MKTSIVCGFCVCALIACQNREQDVTTTRNDAKPVEADKAKPVEADNAKRNERDRADEAITPIDQGNNEADLEITKEIRRQVLAQPDFSINAQNVKIITQDGNVMLRGPVDSADEKATIERLARAQSGVKQFRSELEVKAKENNVKE